MVKRIFVEKKPAFAVEAKSLLVDLQNTLEISTLKNLRIINRYDISGISSEEYELAKNIVLSEPPVDDITDENLSIDTNVFFIVEYLPGQYDQRADSAAQCIQILTQKTLPLVNYAKVYLLYGEISNEQLTKIKNYCINPVEAREADLAKPTSLEIIHAEPADVITLHGFTQLNIDKLQDFKTNYSLAMSVEDLAFCQQYFTSETREPSITEIRVLDTYWSDHCRHTTFNTQIEEVDIITHKYNRGVQEAFDKYQASREQVYGALTQRKITLMDIAVMGMKSLKSQGKLEDLDLSEEINACSIVVPVKIDNTTEDWLVMFKNETHNHPTEIEPFGGAATCLGGAIRDPLSGRAYVYQAMRITGAANPLAPISETLVGKLPQRKITIGAASGYSSYGNQIGLATGYVREYYHPDFVAKRMEVGAVIGAVPKSSVVRQTPLEGDLIILLGGKTGRDGCGGATGSSKEHDLDSLTTCGAEVQKGNAPTERKIQRLFRNPQVTELIKRCNDFGAGGVSVAIGELTDSLEINLDAVPKKYSGLDGTELAISESQERMAVVVAADNAPAFLAFAAAENLEATIVAKVTATNRLVMNWRGQSIVNLSRDFLNTNGIAQKTNIIVKPPSEANYFEQSFQTEPQDLEKSWYDILQDLNVCSQKGLAERFDSTVGANTVVMPFGGKTQSTPAEGMVAKIPALTGEVKTASIMTCGYNPDLAKWSPFHGGMYAAIESISKAVALGANPDKIRLTLQEYFEKLTDEASWGKPFAALLGAYLVQEKLSTPAIGGKDSMSGTFMDKNVPPTLISFAVGIADSNKIVTNEFKGANNSVIFISCPRDEAEIVDFKLYKEQLDCIHKAIYSGRILASATVGMGGIAASISKMCFGNNLGFAFNKEILDTNSLFVPNIGGFLLEVANDSFDLFEDIEYLVLGNTLSTPEIFVNNLKIPLKVAKNNWEKTLEPIFPTAKPALETKSISTTYSQTIPLCFPGIIAKPKVIIPVFPGTNCEYDSKRAFELAGASVETIVIRNYDAISLNESVQTLAKAISDSQILMFPGGFSAGDEPDGSGKFIAALFRNEYLKEAVTDLLDVRQGLVLGICNGFQALIKLGLVPYGKIVDMNSNSPTLTYNNLGRHISTVVSTKITSNLSPWLTLVQPNEIHSIALSHGEGKFYASEAEIEQLFNNGQIATQYVDLSGQPTMDKFANPNGSLHAIEGLSSPDGRVLGKMGHSERVGSNIMQNIHGNKNQFIFQAGVNYFN